MSLIKEFKTKRLLTIVIPTIAIDFLIFAYCRYFLNINPLSLLERAEWFGAIGWPEIIFNPPIMLLLVGAVLSWFLEKDIIFTKILVAKALLFCALAYFSWHKFGLFEEGFETGKYIYIFVDIFLFLILNVLANIPLFLCIYKGLSIKKRLLGGTALIVVNVIFALMWWYIQLPQSWEKLIFIF